MYSLATTTKKMRLDIAKKVRGHGGMKEDIRSNIKKVDLQGH